jgi:hypothetical protein
MRVNGISANYYTAKKQSPSFGNKYSCLSDIVMQNPDEAGERQIKSSVV